MAVTPHPDDEIVPFLEGLICSEVNTICNNPPSASLAIAEAAAPRDEIEAALAVQMACTHTAAMAVLAKMDVAFWD